jgi:hypothetical protein
MTSSHSSYLIPSRLSSIVSNYVEHKLPFTQELKYETYNIFDEVDKFWFENDRIRSINMKYLVSSFGYKICRRTIPIGNILTWDVCKKI